jgi:hypothetical protein
MEAAERSGVRFNMLVLTMPPYELRVCVHVKATLEKKGDVGRQLQKRALQQRVLTIHVQLISGHYDMRCAELDYRGISSRSLGIEQRETAG